MVTAIGQTVKKIVGTQDTEISERMTKEAVEWPVTKINLKARYTKPQRNCSISNAVSPGHSTSKEFTQAVLVLSKVLRSAVLQMWVIGNWAYFIAKYEDGKSTWDFVLFCSLLCKGNRCVLSVKKEARGKEVFEGAAFKRRRWARKDPLQPEWLLPNTASTGLWH